MLNYFVSNDLQYIFENLDITKNKEIELVNMLSKTGFNVEQTFKLQVQRCFFSLERAS